MTIAEAKKQEIQLQYQLQAFNSWLLGAGGKKQFPQFLKSLGLGSQDATKSKSNPGKQVATQHLQNAERILQLDKQIREQKGVNP